MENSLFRNMYMYIIFFCENFGKKKYKLNLMHLYTGSIWCATIEIQVGRSDWPATKDYETLAYTVTLMTSDDCLQARNPNKTQMFSPG